MGSEPIGQQLAPDRGDPDAGGPVLGNGSDAGRHQPSTGRRYSSPGRSALVHWPIVALFVVIGLVLGGGYADKRAPTYTATSYLYVGKTLSLLNTAAIPGLSAAATTVAQDYSRLITTPAVVTDAAKRVGRTPTDLGGTLNASVVAETPEVIVTASGPSSSGAVKLANAGSAALVSAVNQLNTSSAGQLTSLQNTYLQLEQQINQDTLEQSDLQTALGKAEANEPGSALVKSDKNQLATIETQIAEDNLNASTAETQYSNSYSPLVSEEQVLQTTSPAVGATSNRKKSLELGAVGGVFGGLLIGVIVASWADVRTERHGRRRAARTAG